VSERHEPTLDQIMQQWLCLWQMSMHLLSFTPAAIAREFWGEKR
jgi:hypothetical protein